MTPRSDDPKQTDLTTTHRAGGTMIGSEAHAPGPRDAEEKPFDFSMYLHYLPGTD